MLRWRNVGSAGSPTAGIRTLHITVGGMPLHHRQFYLMILVGGAGAHGAEVSSMMAKLGDIYQTVARTSLALTCFDRSLRMAP